MTYTDSLSQTCDPAVAESFDCSPARDLEHLRERIRALFDITDGDPRADALRNPDAGSRLALTILADLHDLDRL